jgi:hypothetical protein
MTATIVSKLDSAFAGFQAIVDIPDLAAGLAGRVSWGLEPMHSGHGVRPLRQRTGSGKN